jgi:hypothetical protein
MHVCVCWSVDFLYMYPSLSFSRTTQVNAFFYGHDHVFSHEVVDGINYVLCGTTSAPWLFGRNETGYSEYIADYGHVHLHKVCVCVLSAFL